jgi:hypothetical protein
LAEKGVIEADKPTSDYVALVVVTLDVKVD